MVVVALLMGVVCRLPIQAALKARRRSQCTQNLRQIGSALRAYHDEWHCFPPAFVADDHGRPTHSWRVLLLPYLGQQDLYDQYRFDEPWDSPHNLSVADQRPSIYHCPSEFGAGRTDTSYLMIVGPGAFSEGNTPITLDDITDGADCTIAIMESSECGICWTRPQDLNTGEMSYDLNGTERLCPRSHHPSNVQTLMADGSIWVLADRTAWDDNITPDMLRILITRAAGDSLLPGDLP